MNCIIWVFIGNLQKEKNDYENVSISFIVIFTYTIYALEFKKIWQFVILKLVIFIRS